MNFKKKRVVFLASGRGSNFEAVATAIQKGKIPAESVALVSDQPEAKAIQIAHGLGIPTHVLPYSELGKENYHKKLLQTVVSLSPDLVVACGYMRILRPEFVRAFPEKILNIHPSLLPAFPGLNAQKQALEYGAKVSGCTVHFVDEGMDTGPVLLQSPVKILPQWTERDLTLAILQEEHELLVQAVRYFCQDQIKFDGRKVRLEL